MGLKSSGLTKGTYSNPSIAVVFGQVYSHSQLVRLGTGSVIIAVELRAIVEAVRGIWNIAAAVLVRGGATGCLPIINGQLFVHVGLYGPGPS